MPVLRDRILEYFQVESPHPLKLRDLAKAMRISDEDYGQLRRMMRQLEQEGAVVRLRNNRYGPPDRLNLAVGRLSVNPSGGFGFVSRETGGEDVFVGSRKMAMALHGDRVVVRLYGHRGSKRQQEGQVIRVLERSLKTVVGVYRKEKRFGYVVPDDSRLTRDIYVADDEVKGAESGQKVVVKIEAWTSEHLNPEGRIVEVLGDPDSPGMDILSIIKEHDLPLDFPDHILHLSESFSGRIPEEEIRLRRDLREMTCFTIDPPDAKDFDDAVSLDGNEDGTILLGVHIADVSHYVREGAALDHEARVRGTSVYLVDRVIPMLPERLSNDLCSLIPGEDRLAISVLADMDAEGNLLDYRLVESVIRSAARLTYDQVQSLLDGDGDNGASLHADRLRGMEALRRKLTDRRMGRGAIDFDLPEAKVLLDPEGNPLDVRRYERKNSHRLIEEFMILANEIVARHMNERGIPVLYRVHDQPDRTKLEEFADLAESFGYRFPLKDIVKPLQISRFLNSIAGKRVSDVINDMLLRSMKKAIYTPKNIGHFGLASLYYTHFTSPIRRYPDLLLHRILREDLRGGLSETRKEVLNQKLPPMGDLSTDREMIAQNAERDSIKVKQVQFMEKRLGDEFEGLVVGVRPTGMFVRIGEYLIDGFVRVNSIEDDYYLFDERMRSLMGQRTGRVFRLGDPVRVRVVRAVRKLRQIDLMLIENDEDASGQVRGKMGVRGRGRGRKYGNGKRTRRRIGPGSRIQN